MFYAFALSGRAYYIFVSHTQGAASLALATRSIGLSARPGYRLPWVGIIAIDLRAKERIFEENSKRVGVLLRRFEADLYILNKSTNI